MTKPAKTPAPSAIPTRFVIDKNGDRVPVAEGEDIVAAARKAKGLDKPAGTETEEN